jgi:predicted CoA-binding protein
MTVKERAPDRKRPHDGSTGLPSAVWHPASADYADPRTIRKIFGYARTVAVVGLSPNRLRPSFFVGGYLQYRGFRIVPVNPTADEVLGERCYPTVSAIPFAVDVVDVFREPAAAPAIADEAIRKGARALWLQFGVVSPEAAERAARAGLDVVMDRCMKIEHGRYFGEMHWFGLNTGIVTSRRPERGRLDQ